MVFVRKKKAKQGNDYYQLVENRRDDGKVRRRVILHLGANATVDYALKSWPREASRLRRSGYEEAADELKAKLDRLKALRRDGAA